MYKLPLDSMVCDSDRGDGNINFYEEYFEWIKRDTQSGFRVWYKNISDIKAITTTSKKTVIVYTNNGGKVNLYLYRFEALIRFLYERMNAVNGNGGVNDVKEGKEDDLARLERLSKLHKEGSLTDEEFTAAKKKILGL